MWSIAGKKYMTLYLINKANVPVITTMSCFQPHKTDVLTHLDDKVRTIFLISTKMKTFQSNKTAFSSPALNFFLLLGPPFSKNNLKKGGRNVKYMRDRKTSAAYEWERLNKLKVADQFHSSSSLSKYVSIPVVIHQGPDHFQLSSCCQLKTINNS